MTLSTSTSTLAAGASRTFNLSPGSALTIVAPPNVRATVTETPNTVSASDVGGNVSRVHNLQMVQTVTYGPYVMGGTVVVENASNSGATITWVRSDSIVAESVAGAVSLVSGDGILPVVFYNSLTGDIFATLPNGSQTLIPVSSSGKVAPWPEFGSGSISVTNDRNARFLLDSTLVGTETVVRQQDVSAASVTQLSIFNTFGVGVAGDASATDWSRLIDFTGIEFWTNSLNAGGTAYAALSFATATGVVTAPSGGSPTPNTATFTVPGALVGQQPNRMVMPITLDSDVRSLFRFVKANNADTVSICYRLINSPMAWEFHGTGEDLITGSGAVAQLAFGNTTIYPADTDGILVQALGTGPVALEWSGAAPSATRGMTLQSGEMRYIDLVGQNIVLSTLRFFVPSGGYVRAKALKKQ